VIIEDKNYLESKYVEHVARAICRADRYDPDSDWEIYTDHAVAAIEAINEVE